MFNDDVALAKEIEKKVACLLTGETFVTKGLFDYDILVNAVGHEESFKVEVKYHKCPQKFIVYEIMNLYAFQPAGLSKSKADYWIDVINHEGEINAYMTKVETLKMLLFNLIKEKKAQLAFGGDNSYMALILVPIEEVKRFGKFKGKIEL